MAFGIYRLLKREVRYPGADVLVPESWQLMAEHVSEQANSAELAGLVQSNRQSSYIMVKTQGEPPQTLALEEGLRLAVATEQSLQD